MHLDKPEKDALIELIRHAERDETMPLFRTLGSSPSELVHRYS